MAEWLGKGLQTLYSGSNPLQTSQKPRCSYLQRGFIFELSYICNTNLYSWLVSSI